MLTDPLLGVQELKSRDKETGQEKTLLAWLSFQTSYKVHWKVLRDGKFLVTINHMVGILDPETGRYGKLLDLPDTDLDGGYEILVE